jgi:hypothetical protein
MSYYMHNSLHFVYLFSSTTIVYPVIIAEIDKVLPKVFGGSFNTEREAISFKSRVSLNMNTKTKWFDLPVKGETINTGEIAEKVYKERFSEETFNRMWELYCGSDSEIEEETESCDGVDAITRELKKVDIPDDWEDLASDSD